MYLYSCVCVCGCMYVCEWEEKERSFLKSVFDTSVDTDQKRSWGVWEISIYAFYFASID